MEKREVAAMLRTHLEAVNVEVDARFRENTDNLRRIVGEFVDAMEDNNRQLGKALSGHATALERDLVALIDASEAERDERFGALEARVERLERKG